jgi:hypothetical protein
LRARPKHLRLVEPPAPPLADVLVDPTGRKEVNELTQQLVDVLIEMMDIVDGDPEREPNGDETEEGDGI